MSRVKIYTIPSIVERLTDMIAGFETFSGISNRSSMEMSLLTCDITKEEETILTLTFGNKIAIFHKLPDDI